MVDEFSPINPDGGNSGGTSTPASPPASNPIIPTENVNLIVPGAGSNSVDFSEYILPDYLIEYLSSSAKSKLLSIANIGSSTSSIIKKSLELIDNLSELSEYLLNETILNNIANGTQSQNIINSNLTSNHFNVIIILNTISPSGAQPAISISNGNKTYNININNTISRKKLIFYNIEKSFVSNFYILNNSGTPFQNGGNSILIVGL
jgi:hypothetical protein